MYRLPQSVSGTLIIILPLRKSDKGNRYRGTFEHAILSLADKLHLSVRLYPRLHQFFEC